jgi:ribonuclease G
VGKRIVVNAGLTETRVAVQENQVLTELYVERTRRRSVVGNVYKGTVTNVLPGMQAAFVDIGLRKDAFLYAGDYTANLAEVPGAGPPLLADGEADDEPAEVDEPLRAPAGPIEELLARGREVLVQVSKESLGTKGARVTSFISLPGRYIVYMPQASHIGVSRRIRDEEERERLRRVVKGLRPPAGGFIVRTVAEGRGEEELAADIQFLTRLWGQIQARFEGARSPSLLHEEGNLTFRVVRDLFAADVEEFLVDSAEGHQTCLDVATTLVPALAPRIRRWTEPTPIFEATGIEREIERAMRRRVWLKSGGYIVIDHTEALVSIDVNTGKYVGKRDFEETVLKINLEAVNEVVRQIRLRDLGGIIIIDFIDMERPEHREQVSRALRRALAEDKARTHVLEISDLGVVEMTRKRARQDLQSLFSAPCPTCRGAGHIKSNATLAAEIFRKVQAEAPGATAPALLVRVHPEMAQYLEGEEREAIERLAALAGRPVTVQAEPGLAREEYAVVAR